MMNNVELSDFGVKVVDFVEVEGFEFGGGNYVHVKEDGTVITASAEFDWTNVTNFITKFERDVYKKKGEAGVRSAAKYVYDRDKFDFDELFELSVGLCDSFESHFVNLDSENEEDKIEILANFITLYAVNADGASIELIAKALDDLTKVAKALGFDCENLDNEVVVTVATWNDETGYFDRDQDFVSVRTFVKMLENLV